MQMILTILTVLLCAGVVIQDLKSRLISVVLLLGMLTCFLLLYFLYHSNSFNNQLVAVNLLFVVSQITALFFYFKLIKKSKESFFENVFGLGDVFMMITIAFVFPLDSLIPFLLSVYLLTILYAFFNKQKGLPLAGIMALGLIGHLGWMLLFTSPILNTFHH